MKQILSGIGLALALALTLAVPALAGGWAVITLDELPGPVTAGEPLEIGFMVRQHGVTPLAGLTPVITARLEGAIKSVKVIAEEKGDVGHYVATLTLPQEGTWEWSIEAFGEPQSMPALTVVAAAVVPQAEESAPEPAFNTTSLLAGIGGLAGVVIGLFVLRSRRRWAIVLVLAGLLVSGYRVVSAANQPKVEEETKPLSAAPMSPEKQVELGRQLFIAKGCVTCHINRDADPNPAFTVEVGPNLTDFKASPEYLRMWLADPKSVKPATKMTTLGLSEEEIEALIAFLNAE